MNLTRIALLTAGLMTVFGIACDNTDEVGLGEVCEQDSQCPSGAVCAAVDGEVEPRCAMPDASDAGGDADDDAGDADNAGDATEDTTDDASDTGDTSTVDAEEDTDDSVDDTENDTTDDAGCDGADTAACAAHWLFITSEKFTGNLGGVSGADSLCQNAATAADLARSDWKAVIADSSTGVRDRIAIDGVVYRTDGTRFAVDEDAFFLRPESKPLAVENGDIVSESAARFYGAWTGTRSEAPATEQCFAPGGTTPWTSASPDVDGHFGFADVADNKAWLQNGTAASCDTEFRLYCISDQ